MNLLEFPIANRSAVVITMREPFNEWVNQLEDRSLDELKHPIVLANVNEEPTVYLSPEIFDPEGWDACFWPPSLASD